MKEKFYKPLLISIVSLGALLIIRAIIIPSSLTNQKLMIVNQKDTNYIDQALLIHVADSINKECPKRIDDVTVLKNTATLRNKTFQYNYILKIDTAKYDMPLLKKLAEQNIFNTFIKTPSSKTFRENNITIVYNYSDTNEHLLFKVIFSPDKYK